MDAIDDVIERTFSKDHKNFFFFFPLHIYVCELRIVRKPGWRMVNKKDYFLFFNFFCKTIDMHTIHTLNNMLIYCLSSNSTNSTATTSNSHPIIPHPHRPLLPQSRYPHSI